MQLHQFRPTSETAALVGAALAKRKRAKIKEVTPEDIDRARQDHGIINSSVVEKDDQGNLTYKGITTLKHLDELYARDHSRYGD